jgi:hypothetical protein
MATITVSGTVLTGNMGDGWSNDEEAAYAYAEFVATRYREIIANEYPDHHCDMSITVQRASGYAPDVRVDVEPWNDAAADMTWRLEERLMQEPTWETFCETEGEAYWSEG